MKKNVGTTDKIVRILVALIIVILYATNVISGTAALILGTFAMLLVVTSFLSFCPIYLPFNISTFKKKEQ